MKYILKYLPVLIFVAAIIFLAVSIFSFSEQDPTAKAQQNSDPIENIEQLWAWGPEDAKVTIVEFSDFECSFCAKAEATNKKIKEAYEDKVKFIYKHFPLATHKTAMIAAQASEAAGYQNKFWEMHDLLFANQTHLSRKNIISYAKQLDLDMSMFERYLDNTNIENKIIEQRTEGDSLGVDATPTFFVNDIRLVGAQPFEVFQEAIESELAK